MNLGNTCTKQEENYFRLWRLVTIEGTEVLRKHFLNTIGGSGSLPTCLAQNQGRLNGLMARKTISAHQYSLLFPNSGPPDINTFDISLLSCLIMNVKVPNQGGIWKTLASIFYHGNQPVKDLRQLRNKLVHQHGSGLSDADFEAHWNTMERIALTLGASTEDFDEYKYMIFNKDLFNEMQKQIKDNDDNYTNISRSLSKIKTWLLVVTLGLSVMSGLYIIRDTESFMDNALGNYNAESDTPPMAEVELGIKKHLVDYYLAEMRYIQPFHWQPDYLLEMEKFSTTIVTEKDYHDSNRVTTDYEHHVHTYLDIFEQLPSGMIPKRILVTGPAGIGKTTLMQGLTYQWAKWTESEFKMSTWSTVYFLKLCSSFRYSILDYEVLFFVDLAKVQMNYTLCDAVYSSLFHNSDIPKHWLCDYIRINKRRLILLLDGYDEYETETSTVITQIIERKRYLQSLVVITTRPIIGQHLQNKRKVDCIYRIQGFNQHNLVKYLHQYFEDDLHSGELLYNELEERHTIDTELLQVPMIVHFICFLWQTEHKLPPTTTELYNKLVSYSLQRRSHLYTTNMTIEDIQLQLGHIALSTENETWPELFPFNQSKALNPAKISAINGTGFIALILRLDNLLQSAISNDKNTKIMPYNFIHNSFKDYFIAFYLEKYNHTVPFLKMLLNTVFNDSSYYLFSDRPYLHRFICGMASSNQTLKEILHTYYDYYEKFIKAEFKNCDTSLAFSPGLFTCLKEGHGSTEVWSIINHLTHGISKMDNLVNFILPFHLQVHDQKNVSKYCLHGSNNKYGDYLSHCLRYFTALKKLLIGSYDRVHNDFINDKFYAMYIPKSDFSAEIDTKAILKHIRHLHNLEELGFSDINLKGWGYILRDTLCAIGRHLETLGISFSKMGIKDWKYIMQSTKCLNNLKKLTLTENIFGEVYPFQFYDSNKLTEFSLTSSIFSTKAYIRFTQTFRRMQSLKAFDFDGKSIICGREYKLANLRYLKSLREIKAHMLNSDAAGHVFKALAHMKLLNLIDLSWQDRHSNKLSLLVKSLSNFSCSIIKKSMEVQGKGFTMTDSDLIPHYTTHYQENTGTTIYTVTHPSDGIHTLRLHTDTISPDGLKGLKDILYKLGACSIKRLDITVQSGFPHIPFLSFASNFIHLKRLEHLSLSGLDPETSVKLVRGLKFLDSTTELSLQKNNLGDFLTEFYEGALKKMTELRMLDFTNSTFSPDSLRHLDDVIKELTLMDHDQEGCYGTSSMVILRGVQQITNEKALDLCNLLCNSFEDLSEVYNKTVKTMLKFDHPITDHIRANMRPECKKYIFLS